MYTLVIAFGNRPGGPLYADFFGNLAKIPDP